MTAPTTPLDNREEQLRGYLELIATILIAIATVLTAWSAFQSTKWSGVQANSYASANATRTEATQAATRAGQEIIIDLTMFVQWAAAVNQEFSVDPEASIGPDGIYVPQPDTLSGFLFERFRSEFEPAVAAWLEFRPLENPDAPSVPFEMDEYVVADAELAGELGEEADELSTHARRANQRGDNYVLTTVLFATVLFFAGISSKFRSLRNRTALIALGSIILVAGVGILTTYPVEF
jgi:hypothetical protein